MFFGDLESKCRKNLTVGQRRIKPFIKWNNGSPMCKLMKIVEIRNDIQKLNEKNWKGRGGEKKKKKSVSFFLPAIDSKRGILKLKMLLSDMLNIHSVTEFCSFKTPAYFPCCEPSHNPHFIRYSGALYYKIFEFRLWFKINSAK